MRPGGISRVIVLSDGDANIGSHTHDDMLEDHQEERAKRGVALSTIGFGRGNYKDTTMEQLADKGNGNILHRLARREKRIFSEQLTSTLEVAAKDVKLQVEFDPAQVSKYRPRRLREPRRPGRGLRKDR